ncbi:UV DNA damage repair endonuclease UvsE [Marinilactibacillus sp. GCM10026970]|uniref:UV DNA damage repair endonuclease UvsE n=1 Tax=Marinilactibacillus sp. GCM10026970 TaxID=3252642 RepID=UPI003609C41B
MSIGYPCITVGVADTKQKTCRKASATEEHLSSLIEHNLTALKHIIEFNGHHQIRLFRISSDIIPFASDKEVNTLNWSEQFFDQFQELGQLISQYKMRVSMHPGQYTVLNSPDEDVVKRAIADLEYHTLFLDSLGVDSSSKLILHVGGVYGDKGSAMDRFVEVYNSLSENIKDRLVIENDDRSYTIEEVLTISERTGAPAVYDNLHNAINSSDDSKSDAHWIKKAKQTWKTRDGRQKTHYSQQQMNNRTGSHSKFIAIDEFMKYYSEVEELDIDIMLEVKDKNLSAVKCVLATTKNGDIKDLYDEWNRYKYVVLERSQDIYESIQSLLQNQSSYPVIPFYRLIEAALDEEPTSTTGTNAANQVWGYIENSATEKEQDKYRKLVQEVKNEESTLKKLKTYLKKLIKKYDQQDILDSLYFEF